MYCRFEFVGPVDRIASTRYHDSNVIAISDRNIRTKTHSICLIYDANKRKSVLNWPIERLIFLQFGHRDSILIATSERNIRAKTNPTVPLTTRREDEKERMEVAISTLDVPANLGGRVQKLVKKIQNAKFDIQDSPAHDLPTSLCV